MSVSSSVDTFEKASVSASLVLRLLDALVDVASGFGHRMSFAVVDENGVAKATLRMDGASFTSTSVAADKAYTAAGGRATHQWHEAVAGDAVLAQTALTSIPRLTTLGGGFPIMVDGRVVGGLGVSGGHYTDDMAVARAAMERVGARHEQ